MHTKPEKIKGMAIFFFSLREEKYFLKKKPIFIFLRKTCLIPT